MHAIDCLTEDHRQLSSKLAALEVVVAMGDHRRDVVEDSCRSVVQLLRDHIAREERFVGACSRELGAIDSAQLEWLAIEHHEVHRQLQVITWLLREELPKGMGELHVNLAGTVGTLRHQMSEQEAKLFPFLRPVMDRVGPLQQGPSSDVSSRCRSS